MTSSLRLPLWILGISVIIAIVAGGITAAVMAAGNAPSDEVPASVISADTRMGAVELKTSNIEAMTDYYGPDGVGLSVLGEEGGIRSLGVDGEELIRLVPTDAELAAPTEAGLYHTAILFPDAPALAGTLAQLASTYPGLYGGSADHAVSHAFYFGDPEGNGVELYVDTPREDWVWEDGYVQMGSEPLDINRFINDNLGEDSTGEATMGHVHLKVGNLEQAEAFYGDTLGFAVTARANGAIFLSAGGYHHHLAANTWGSAGAGVRSDSLGLGSLEVVVPDASELDAVASRLTDAGLEFEQTDAAITVADPWGTVVELSAK
ncbi:VOC family protein [Diaminobutyricimonas sp. LJ205]|uniref:VOC family protein n=1 Tax=Diaminobutyricimonas sp. LJ205 TaxID=2683590 RepID=UPI0012F4B3DD|nr:VOC family protein [Diaminobutyricimonas sp. LJ205]